MVIVSVLYPNTAGSRFDYDYYRETHLPLVRELLEPSGMRSMNYVIPTGDANTVPFRLIAELRFETMEATNAALLAHGAKTQADIVNFTDITPHIVIGDEIVA